MTNTITNPNINIKYDAYIARICQNSRLKCNITRCDALFTDICSDEYIANNHVVLSTIISDIHIHSQKCLSLTSIKTIVKIYLTLNDITSKNISCAPSHLLDLYISTYILLKKNIQYELMLAYFDSIPGSWNESWDHAEDIVADNNNSCLNIAKTVREIFNYDGIIFSPLYVHHHKILCFMNTFVRNNLDFFKKMFDTYFEKKTNFSIIDPNDMFNKLILISGNDINYIIYDVIKYIIKNKYITLTDDHMDHASRDGKHNMIEILMDNKIIFTKKHLHKLFSHDAAIYRLKMYPITELISQISTQTLNFIRKHNVEITYDDVIFCCQEGLTFPKEYIKHIQFDDKYFDVCKNKNMNFYNYDVVSNTLCSQKFIELQCLVGITLYDFKKLIKEHNITPTQKCLENACCIRSNTQMIKYLLSLGLKINTTCLTNMSNKISSANDKLILSKYLESKEENNKNNEQKQITKLNKTELCSKNKKRASYFGDICSSIKPSSYITYSSFRKHLNSYIANEKLLKEDDNVLINDTLSKLSLIEHKHYVNKNDMDILATIMYNNAK